MKKKFNYDHLYYFWIVGRCGGLISRAAKELAISQPSLSSQIQVLEQSLGYDVLEPYGRSCRLTEKGAALYSLCASMFYESELIEVVK